MHRLLAIVGLLMGITWPVLAISQVPGDRVGFDQHLGLRLPLAATFIDESDRATPLGSYFGKRPVVIILAYYACANLCTLVIDGLMEDLKKANLATGTDLDVVVVSINPTETAQMAAAKKTEYMAMEGKTQSPAGWHFLTGPQASITLLAQAIGFRYFYDPGQRQYAHPAGITLATPEGNIARYFFGVQFAPDSLQSAVEEASRGRIGGLTHQLLLLCFHYDPTTGKYTVIVMRWVRAIALLTLLAISAFALYSLRRERRTGEAG